MAKERKELLFAKNKKEMLSSCPSVKPKYQDANLSPYSDEFQLVKETAEEDPYHYGWELLNLLQQYPEHEIGTHTFSHYYCLEKGESKEAFREDLLAAKRIASDKGIPIESLVFPRNQYAPHHLEVCHEVGIKTYRGTEKVWFRKSIPESDTTLALRIVRTLDCYVNISGHHVYNLEDLVQNIPYNIPSSRFFRPYMKKGGRLAEKLKLRRIKGSMTYAAKNGLVYHLWWHPHNFASHTKDNIATLSSIFEHFLFLKNKYGFENRTMGEVGSMLDTINGNIQKDGFYNKSV